MTSERANSQPRDVFHTGEAPASHKLRMRRSE
jgi:hypothetical protein